jgi:hypothetical protein
MGKEVRGPVEQVLSVVVPDFDAMGRPHHALRRGGPWLRRLPRRRAGPPPGLGARLNELAEAADDRVLSKVVARYGRLDLLLVDELDYVSVDPKGAEPLFQVLTEREERASMAVASNAPFSR